jgi:hypothetical protein
MAHKVAFAEGMNIIPVLAPKDTAATAVGTEFVDLDLANWCSFLVMFGNMTSDSTDTVTVIVEATSDGASSGEVAIPFKYRLSSAVATNAWGAITAGTSDGITVTAAANDSMALWIDIDPAAVQGAGKTDGRFVRVFLTPLGPITLVSACAFVETRYPGNSIPSSS